MTSQSSEATVGVVRGGFGQGQKLEMAKSWLGSKVQVEGRAGTGMWSAIARPVVWGQ